MLQRIQTLYLLLVVILGTLLCFFSPVDFLLPEATDYVHMNLFSCLRAGWQTVPFAISILVIPVLALVDIFLYRKRILQARLNIFTVVFCLGFYAIMAVYIWFAKKTLDATPYITIWASIPLISMILTLMATRRILKDEALVRAADRIR